MKAIWALAVTLTLPIYTPLPPSVTKHPVSGYKDMTVYERPADALPSFWNSFFSLFRIPTSSKVDLPFQRSVAVLVGVGHYRFITPHLEYISKDVEQMRDYLLGDGGFDAVYVTDEGVSPGELDKFMVDDMPKLLGPNDRLLFYYSGHGADPGSGYPVLQFQQAQPDQWGHDVLRVDEFEQWSGILRSKHVLFIYDACTAGEATEPKSGSVETRAAVAELSGNGSRIVVTAGTSNQQSWILKESATKQYSLFTQALLTVLRDGTAESRARGFITIGQAVADASVILADETHHLGPGHEMKPDQVSIDRKRTGTFVFLNPHADRPTLPQADIIAMGIKKGTGDQDLDERIELALWQSIEPLDDPRLFEDFCEKYPNGIFCPVAQKRIQILESQSTASTPTNEPSKMDLATVLQLISVGSPGALTQLGKIQEGGLQGTPRNVPSAIANYKAAADKGDSEASYRIGEIYNWGREDVPADKPEALKWFRKAAEDGDSHGMERLADAYYFGYDTLPQDNVQAAVWYRKAAEAGGTYAMARLGGMYMQGLGGLPKDEKQGLIWIRKSADAGDGLGATYLGNLYREGDAGLTKDEREALRWFRRGADLGDGQAMVNIGGMYFRGQGGLTQDYTQALVWFRKASEAGQARGLADVGVMYLNGLGGVEKDDVQAVNWFRRAANQNDCSGMELLGFMYEQGRGGLPRDINQALYYYRRSAENCPSAQADLKRLGAS